MSSRTRYSTLETIRERIHAYQDPELNTAAADLDHAAPHAHDAFRRMQDARAGLPGAQAYDSPSVSGGGRSASHPERMAEQDDRTEPDRRLLDTYLTQLEWLTRPDGAVIDPGAWRRDVTRRCHTIRNIVDAWTPRPPSARDLRLVEEANTSSPECAITREALNLTAPVHCTSNLWGLVPDPVPVSRWVWRFAKDHRRLPTPMEWTRQRSKDDDLRSQAMATVK